MSNLKEVLSHLPLQGEIQYENPVSIMNSGNKHSIDNPDPYVIKYNGEYYCYTSSTGGPAGINILNSKDLINWTNIGYAFVTENEKEFWAPCVIYNNGIFYMYYSSIQNNEDDCHLEFMKVAISNDPKGPFKYQRTLFDTFSIDAHVVRDIDGTYYLIYSTNEYMGGDEKRPGTVILLDELVNMVTLAENPKLLIKPTLDEEIFENNRFGDGRDWHTIEGAFYFKKNSKAYIMYSGNAYTHEKYFVGYSIADASNNKKISEMIWTKYPDENTYNPVLKMSSSIRGTGHNSVIKAPDNVEDFIIYHGRSLGFEERSMRIDPLIWSGEEMWIPGPSNGRQSVPWVPAFRDLFDTELNNQWELISGEWKVKDGELIQNKVDCIASALVKLVLEHYIFEVSLKCTLTHMGAIYGVYICFEDSFNNVQLLIDAGKKCVKVISSCNGVQKQDMIIALDKGFKFKCYHKIIIKKFGLSFKVFIDDNFILKSSSDFKGGKVGLISHYARAQYAGLSITNNFKLDETTTDDFRKIICICDNGLKSPWNIEKGSLICNRNLEKNKLSFKKAFLKCFKMSFNFLIKDSMEEGYVHIYPIYESERDYLKICLNKGSKKIFLTHIQNSIVKVQEEFDLDEGFNIKNVHSIYINKEYDNIYVLMDRYIIYQGDINIKLGCAAFYSNIHTEFYNIDITQK